MLLSIFSTIGNWISSGVKSAISISSDLVSDICRYAFDSLVSLLMFFFTESLTLGAFGISLLVGVFDKMLNQAFHNIPYDFDKKMPKEPTIAQQITASIVKNVNEAFEAMKCEEAIKKLNLRPNEYFKVPDTIRVVENIKDNIKDDEVPLESIGTVKAVKDVVGDVDTPFTVVQDIVTNVIAPSAMVVFSLIIMVELFQITTRTEGMRNSGFEAPFKLMVKVAICKIFLDHSKDVLNAIINFSHEMFIELYNFMMQRDYNFNLMSSDDAKYLSEMHYISLLAWWLSVWVLCGCIKAIINFVLPFVVLARMLELYMMIALAPLPFATFANQEFSQVGKNFIKQFIGIALKSFIIYLIIIIYSATFSCLMVQDDGFHKVMNAICSNGVQIFFSVAGFWGILFLLVGAICIKPLIFCFMLMGTIFSADRYTKLITGAFY